MLTYKKMCAESGRYVILYDIEDFYLCVLRLHGHLSSFMEELKEKEYYRQAIVDTIMKIDRLDVLIYFYTYIIGKLKAGR